MEKHSLNQSYFFFMQKTAYEISKQTSDLIDRYYFAQADLIITLCGDAKDKCPAVPNNHEHLHWDLKDPAQAVGSEEEILAEFRKVREVIKRKVLDLNQRTSIV
ncbi:arsenate reductase [Enterococcus faecium]|nr:arsenate reductase [Enterococcus faecium]